MTFDFFNVPRIVFGRGAAARLAEFVPPAARTLLVYNGRRIDVPGAVADFHQRGEPTVTDIDRALEIGRGEQCDFVVGLGGGSAIDAAKAVAGLLANGGVASDYMEVVGKGRKIQKPALPWIAVPTTAGTGAEVTRNAVIGWPEKKFKASIRSELLMAPVALIDPQLHVGVPREITARSGADALCQCVEAYVSTGANPMTDAIAIKGVELAARYLERAVDNGGDLEAREGMALAALMSGIALTNAGLGAVHGFAAPLGANFPAPHGAVCAALLPHVMAANVAALRAQSRDHPALQRYAMVGAFISTGDNAGTEDASIRDAIDEVSVLVEKLKIPPLSTFGVSEADVLEMVQLAKKSSSMRYNPVVLSDDVLADVLRKAL
jgi:alcohol dehydrogenase class IV